MKGTFGNKESGLTLRLTVHGDPASAPAYVRDPGAFQVTDADRAAAESGSAQGGGSSLPSAGGQGGGQEGQGGSGRTNRMTVVGIAGIGTGSVLVLGLGLWTYVARRRAPAGW